MKKKIVLLVFLMTVFGGFGQNERVIDSLKKELKYSNNNAEKSKILYLLTNENLPREEEKKYILKGYSLAIRRVKY